jgi:hypothetical protein
MEDNLKYIWECKTSSDILTKPQIFYHGRKYFLKWNTISDIFVNERQPQII